MAGQSVTFDFTSKGASQVAGDFRKTGDSAVLAAKGARLLSDALEKQRKASDVSAGATLALAKADRILADAEHTLTDGALEAEFALKKEAEAADKAKRANEGAAGGMSALAGTGGIPGGGMGAAIAAGALLAPVLVTVGFGLGGLGLAAAGVIKPIENAAQKTGGLQKNMHLLNAEQQTVARGILGLGTQYHKFEAALQPTLLKDFSAGLRLAGTVLHEVEPVAASTGKALGTLLGQIGGDLQSSNWRSFFTWMAAQAGPDIKLIGSAVVSLLDSLPSLLKDLQPVSVQLLTFTDDAAKLIDVSSRLSQQLDQVGHKANTSGGWVGFLAAKAKQAIGQMVPGIGAAKGLEGWLGKLGDSSKPAANGIADTGKKAATSAVHLQTMADAVTALNTAESKSLDTQLAYSNALITAANDAASLRQALKASGNQIGFHTAAQRASFSAANTYISDLEQVAQKSWASGAGTKGAASAIANALPLLESAATKNKNYWQEVRTLKQWLDKLRAEKNIREAVIVTGSGTWHVPTPKNQSLPGGYPGGSGAAAGMLVRGGVPGRDSVPIMAMPGEAVVPKSLVPAVAPFLSANRVPGFASGGIVPSYAGTAAGLKPWGNHNRAATITDITASIAGSMARAFAAAVASAGAFGAGGVSGTTQYAEEKFAASLFPHYGWSGLQILPLGALWNQESGWNRFAYNASSGATGIPQALPYSKMPRAAWLPSQGGQASAAAQIAWGLSYIAGRYGTPAGAWAHERAFNWYDKGGWLMPGLTLAMNKTGRPERILPPGHSGGGVVKHVFEFRAASGADNLTRAIVEVIQHHVSNNGGDVAVALGEKY